jgi:hypothetical protein
LEDLSNQRRGAEKPPLKGAFKEEPPLAPPEPQKVEVEEFLEPDELTEEDDEADDLDDIAGLGFYPGHPDYQPIDVIVKNTFIELPNPCTPEKGTGTSKEAIAATCPAKYALSGEQRREYDEAKEDAEEAALQFGARKDCAEKVDMATLDPCCSVGSLLHKAGMCKPCAWYHHPKGCQRAAQCEFCHMCPPGEIKRRKKEKTQLIRKRRGKDEAEPSERGGIKLESISRLMEPNLGVQQQSSMFSSKNARRVKQDSPLDGVLPSLSPYPDYPEYDPTYPMPYDMQAMHAQFASAFPPQLSMNAHYPYPPGADYSDYAFPYW